MTVPLAMRARELDAADPLGDFRDRFAVPQGVIYLDGNSLGCLPKATPEALSRAVEREWGEGLIRSWNPSEFGPGWFEMGTRIGAKIAPLIGAQPRSV